MNPLIMATLFTRLPHIKILELSPRQIAVLGKVSDLKTHWTDHPVISVRKKEEEKHAFLMYN